MSNKKVKTVNDWPIWLAAITGEIKEGSHSRHGRVAQQKWQKAMGEPGLIFTIIDEDDVEYETDYALWKVEGGVLQARIYKTGPQPMITQFFSDDFLCALFKIRGVIE